MMDFIIPAVLLLVLYGITVGIILPKMVDKRISAYQNTLVDTHYAEVENVYREMRGWKHDYHNHMQVIKAYLDAGQISACGEYLQQLEQDLKKVDTVVKTGNMKTDPILNSKLSLAKHYHIPVDVTAKVPEKMQMTDTELCVMIGNLMDNAIEACLKIKEEDKRFIRIYIGTLKKQFYISITNSTAKKYRTKGKYLTEKGKNHGFGLSRVDTIVKKYGGYLNRQNEPEVFATEIMLPMKTEEEPLVQP